MALKTLIFVKYFSNVIFLKEESYLSVYNILSLSCRRFLALHCWGFLSMTFKFYINNPSEKDYVVGRPWLHKLMVQ